MTVTITRAVYQALIGESYSQVARPAGAAVVLLTLGLLALREIAAAWNTPRSRELARMSIVAMVPLLLAAGLILVFNFLANIVRVI